MKIWVEPVIRMCSGFVFGCVIGWAFKHEYYAVGWTAIAVVVAYIVYMVVRIIRGN